MADNDDILGTGEQRSFRLGSDVAILMAKGAAYAAIFCLVVGVGIAVLVFAGRLLPEDSRNTPDPTPYTFNLTTPLTVQAG